eukprot:gene14368-biopygen5108
MRSRTNKGAPRAPRARAPRGRGWPRRRCRG